MTINIFSGIHAREWISPATATYLAKQLAEKKSALLASWDVYILPLANPDGYVDDGGDGDDVDGNGKAVGGEEECLASQLGCLHPPLGQS